MFDFVLLFKHEEGNKETPTLIEKFPDGIEYLQDEFQFIAPNSIPKSFDKSEIYMFNTSSQYYYDYSFKVENVEASIVIVSSHFHPSLFIDFLRSVDLSFDTSSPQSNKNSPLNNDKNKKITKKNENKDPDIDTTIYCRFIFVRSLLNSWTSNDEGDLVINYPFDSFIIKLSPDLSVYCPKYQIRNFNGKGEITKNQPPPLNRNDVIRAEDDAISALHSWTDVFDVAPLVPHVETVWATAIQNKGVFVVAQNASISSCSAISILSMLEPMNYAEPSLLFTQIGDPRFTIQNLAPNALNYKKNNESEIDIPVKEVEKQVCQDQDDIQNNRKSNNSNITSKYKIVATTYESYVKLIEMISETASLSESDSIALLNQNFAAIITIKATEFKNSVNIKRIYTKKTKKILKKFLALMNLTLLNDPYFDILEKEVDGNQFVDIWPNDDIVIASALSLDSRNKTKYYFNSVNSNSTSIETINYIDNTNNNSSKHLIDDNDDNNSKNDNNNNYNNGNTYYGITASYDAINRRPSAAELIQFYRNIQKTNTFKKWRHIREDRDQLKMGFLSVTPKEAVEKIPDEKLNEAYEKVSLLLNAHNKDEHYRIILSKNLSLIKKKIRKIKSK